MMKKPVVLAIVALVVIVAPVTYFANKRIKQKVGTKMAEKVLEAQTGAKVDINSNGGDVTIKTDNGQTQYSTGGEAKLPDGFPQELVIVNDAKVIMASSSDNGSSVTYLTNDDQTAVFDKYHNGLPGLGWKLRLHS